MKKMTNQMKSQLINLHDFCLEFKRKALLGSLLAYGLLVRVVEITVAVLTELILVVS